MLSPGSLASPRRPITLPQPKNAVEAAEDIAPPEDLMREHGVLNRILLIYEECLQRIGGQKNLDPAPLAGSAKIIRTFIEDYHEKLEEDQLFPASKRRASSSIW